MCSLASLSRRRLGSRLLLLSVVLAMAMMFCSSYVAAAADDMSTDCMKANDRLTARIADLEARLKAMESKMAQLLDGIDALPAAGSSAGLARKLAAPATDPKLEARLTALETKVNAVIVKPKNLEVESICIGMTCLSGGESLYFKHKTTKLTVVQINHKNYDLFQVFPVPSDNSKWFFVNQVYQFGFWDRIAARPLGMVKATQFCNVEDAKCVKEDIVKKVNTMWANGGTPGGGVDVLNLDKLCVGNTCLEGDGDSKLLFRHKVKDTTLMELDHDAVISFKLYVRAWDHNNTDSYLYANNLDFGLWDDVNQVPYGQVAALSFLQPGNPIHS